MAAVFLRRKGLQGFFRMVTEVSLHWPERNVKIKLGVIRLNQTLNKKELYLYISYLKRRNKRVFLIRKYVD